MSTLNTSIRSLLILALFAAGAEGQDRSVSWVETTRIEAAGTVGTLLQAIPGGLNESRSEHGIHFTAGKLRQDDGSSSVILDIEDGRWISLDHDARSYISMSFAESVEMMSSMGKEAGAEMRQARAQISEMDAEAAAERDRLTAEMRGVLDEASEELRLDFEVRPTGETRRIGDYTASRYLITARLEAAEDLEGVEDTEAGAIAFVAERWQSEDFPSTDAMYDAWARELAEDPGMQAMAAEMAESLQPLAEGFNTDVLATWDPRVAGGLQRMAEVAESLTGTALQTTFTIAFLPTGVELDADSLLAWQPTGMGDAVRAEAADQARSAVRGALRGLTRGRLGRSSQEQAKPEATEARPLLRVVREITDVRNLGAPAPELFGISAGYEERRLPTPASPSP